MPYNISRADLDSISDPEAVFSTQRLLPDWADIPVPFQQGNAYTKLAEAICFSGPLPEGEIVLRKNFDDPGAPAALNRCVRAHLLSFGPSHNHKIAGVGYMISQVCELRAIPESSGMDPLPLPPQ